MEGKSTHSFSSHESTPYRPDHISLTLPRADILRATRPKNILRKFGHHLRKSMLDMHPEQLAELWGESTVVSEIDEFLSHCWNCNPILKTLTLLWYYNSSSAFVLALLVAASICALQRTGQVAGWIDAPNAVDSYTSDVLESENGELAMYCLLAGSSVFVIVMLCGQNCNLRIFHPRIFFDKICINQVDVELRTMGIYGLGAMLTQSSTMVVLWSQEYFSRLWCTFELACYLKLHPNPRVVLYPIFVGFLMPMVFCCAFFFNFIDMVSMLFAMPRINVLVAPAGVIMFIVFIAVGRPYQRHRAKLLSQISEYDARNAQCRKEVDRVIVFDFINAWYGPTLDGNDIGGGLDRFSVFLRERMADIIQGSFGNRVGLPFWSIPPAGLPGTLMHLDFIAMGYPAAGRTLLILNDIFIFQPTQVAIFMIIAWNVRRRYTRPVIDKLVNVVVGCFAALVSLAYAESRRIAYDAGIPILLLYSAVNLGVVVLIWRDAIRKSCSSRDFSKVGSTAPNVVGAGMALGQQPAAIAEAQIAEVESDPSPGGCTTETTASKSKITFVCL